jgi:hypothetical protein
MACASSTRAPSKTPATFATSDIAGSPIFEMNVAEVGFSVLFVLRHAVWCCNVCEIGAGAGGDRDRGRVAVPSLGVLDCLRCHRGSDSRSATTGSITDTTSGQFAVKDCRRLDEVSTHQTDVPH